MYLARHTLIGREAAIKVLLPELCGNEAIVARFFNEAKTTTAIRHPGIVEIYDFGVADTGGAYLVMERLEGETLGRRLRRVGRLRVEHALALARQVTGALYAAHKLGVVHRDLKPDNIYIVSDPEVPGGERGKILDFGIAKLRDKNGFSALQTQEGTVMGAPTYMSPEQCAGAEKVDHRTDLYALGCILFEMVCGRVPFEGSAYGDVMIKQVKMPAPRPSALEPSVPPGLDQLILGLMEKDPERRPKDAFVVLSTLHELSGLAAPMPVPVIPMPTPSPLDGPPTVDESALPFESQDGLAPAPALAAGAPIYNPTMSGVVSSARRTLALGPRGKHSGGAGPGGAGGPGGPAEAMARAAASGGRIDMMPVPAAPPSMPTMAISQAQQGGGDQGALGGVDGRPMSAAEAPTLWDGVQAQPSGSASMPMQSPMGGPGMGGPMGPGGPAPMGGPGMGGPGMGGPDPMGGAPMGGPGPMGMPGHDMYEQGRPMQPGPMRGGTMPVGRRGKSGRLGLIVVILAILAGGASAYFIATSEDFGDGGKAATTSGGQAAAGTAGDSAGKTAAGSAGGAGMAAGANGAGASGAGATQATAADAGAAAAAAAGADAGTGMASAAGTSADAGEEEVLVESPEANGGSGPVDPETNRRPTALVTIQIDSLPRGAAVIRRVDGVKLGETPFTYQTEPQGGSIALILRHKGYRDEVVNVPGNRSSERKVPLSRSRGADRAPDIHDPDFTPDPNGRWPRRGVPE